MDAGVRTVGERRLAARAAAPESIRRVRVRSGYDALVLNLSLNGALLETDCRLLPGGYVELRFLAGQPRIVRARVMRSTVTRLAAHAVWYAGGVRFSSPFRPD